MAPSALYTYYHCYFYSFSLQNKQNFYIWTIQISWRANMWDNPKVQEAYIWILTSTAIEWDLQWLEIEDPWSNSGQASCWQFRGTLISIIISHRKTNHNLNFYFWKRTQLESIQIGEVSECPQLLWNIHKNSLKCINVPAWHRKVSQYDELKLEYT